MVKVEFYTSESVTEGHNHESSQNFINGGNISFFHEISSPKNTRIIMENKISLNEKREYLPYIKENFGRLSQREIARRLELGKTTVNRWSKEIGLEHKKHTVNENFFDTFDENAAYLLGYIYADGNISWDTKKGYYTLTITASEKDKDNLEKVRYLLSSTKPLLYAPKTKSYRLIANSKTLCQKLMKLGVIPRKSLTVKFPDIPKDQLRHFIRGVIDGDGNVRYVERKRSPYFEITIASGSKDFCEGIVKSIRESIGIDANIRKVSQNTYVIQYSCSRGEKLADFIYTDAHLFLERKHAEYNKIIKEEE